ncbi:FAD/NAD(P)-binding domain-containing protein [Aspergillus sclerotioniger CBS 115572]|uniref:FAD/NAD(P)-binding domain-containing protein n=1 Tax=Aspergillus sclerotioniger CBS 115572 TaxID=1450535 RepID=A0A317VEI4_9EURO|nr:FAD/NAD(P)-binding domain-containing protein [Aspergillus sclerotioniger CBS 115572]PWY70290.1 FAD/NAD(P)-binding domain-containing protein [Aspergillus sclerotioniger CBS 115572]
MPHTDANRRYTQLSVPRKDPPGGVPSENNARIDDHGAEKVSRPPPPLTAGYTTYQPHPTTPLPTTTPILIIGAGWAGIQCAIRLLERDIPATDIRIVDSASDFGGTWYWNRYPGLTCDIESYSYLPYLEETGYVPSKRYATGEEIRGYVDVVVRRWGLGRCGVFGTKVERARWDEAGREWVVGMVRGEEKVEGEVRARFVVVAAGVLNWPKLPDVDGLGEYMGEVFHAARWRYEEKGLEGLKGKRVVVVGTGATAVQIVPVLARWCERLVVVQRTAASVAVRDQRVTDEEWFWREVAGSKGWQRERIRNFHQQFTLGEKPAVDLVDDGWTHSRGLVGLTGDVGGPMLPEEIPAYQERLIEMDAPRQAGIHARVDREVEDPDTAERLKPWYPVWCKRPLFHDEYLKTFNRENVTLVDTDGKGIERMTTDSVVIGGKSYQADVVIFATGYLAPPAGTPAEKANMSIIGLNGVSMSEEWSRVGPTTLHGVIDAKFPNLFLSSPEQAATSGNYRFSLDEYAKHIAYILTESMRRADGERFVVAPSMEAAEDWALQVMMRSAPMGVVLGCTPGYLNLEGDLDRLSPEKQMVLARSGIWGWGIEHWLGVIEDWRAEGSMKGIVVL